MNMLSRSLTTTCEGVGMLHSDSNKATVSFTEHCKDILTEYPLILGKFGY